MTELKREVRCIQCPLDFDLPGFFYLIERLERGWFGRERWVEVPYTRASTPEQAWEYFQVGGRPLTWAD